MLTHSRSSHRKVKRCYFLLEYLVQNLAGKCELMMDKETVEKCLAFCQALSSNNQLFTFSLNIGGDSFNFNLKELAKSSCIKKKKSPSQLRREERRKEQRKAATKAEEDTAQVSEQSMIVVKPKGDICGTIYNSEEELNAHTKSDHKTLPSPEKERSTSFLGERQLSPIHIQRDEEKLSEQEGSSSPTPSAVSPPSSWFCGIMTCFKTFTNADDLRVYYHLEHDKCIREEFTSLCPWGKCDSHIRDDYLYHIR